MDTFHLTGRHGGGIFIKGRSINLTLDNVTLANGWQKDTVGYLYGDTTKSIQFNHNKRKIYQTCMVVPSIVMVRPPHDRTTPHHENLHTRKDR